MTHRNLGGREPRYIISEGTPTAYGGRTVRLELPGVLSAQREPWTPDDDAQLLYWMKQRHSYAVIAEQMGRTRDAIISRHLWLKRKGVA